MKLTHTIYQAKQLPVLQNQVFSDASTARSCPRGDLNLVQDLETGLIFNSSFDPKLMGYDSNYQNEQSLSACFQNHLENVSSIIKKHCDKLLLIEVGCGKGYFLEMLATKGANIIGLDPAYEGNSPLIKKEYFSEKKGLQGGAIILRHVLEHIPKPVDFLIKIRDANGGGGKVYIEVPCLDWIRDHGAWYDLFYEHVNYFRLSDFDNMFETVYESGHIFGGQYLYVVADIATIRKPSNIVREPFCFSDHFSSGTTRFAQLLREQERQAQIVLWGASSKGVIFALYMERIGVNIDFVIDINPAKQGKFLPATGLPVYSPKQAMECLGEEAVIIVMNENYLTEVKQLTNNKYNYWKVEYENI
ncbi:MAG: class I SAM-dependent methyltransferase [Kiritimatiellia bacterium]